MTDEDIKKAVKEGISEGFASDNVSRALEDAIKDSEKSEGRRRRRRRTSTRRGERSATDAADEDTIVPIVSFYKKFYGKVLPRQIQDLSKTINNVYLKPFEPLLNFEDNLGEYADDLRNAYNIIQEDFGGIRRANQAASNELSNNLKDSIDSASELFTMSADKLKESGMNKYVMDLGKSTDGATAEVNLLTQAFGSQYEALEDYNSLVKQYSDTYANMISEGFKDNAVDIGVTAKVLNLTSDQIGTFITRQINLTGEASSTMIDDLIHHSYAVAEATGGNAKVIAQTTQQIVANVERFGNVTVEEAARMSGALNKLGVSFSSFDKMLGKFQGFDSAAEAVGNLSALFGVNVDAMEMMKLANTDQEEFMYRMRDTFMDQGMAVQDMNLAQQRALSSMLGMDIPSLQQFFSGDMMDLDEMKEKAEAVDPGEAIKRLNQDLLSMRDTAKNARELTTKNLQDVFVQPLMKDALDMSTAIRNSGTLLNDSLKDVVKNQGQAADDFIKGGFSRAVTAANILGKISQGKPVSDSEYAKIGLEPPKEPAAAEGKSQFDQIFQQYKENNKRLIAESGIVTAQITRDAEKYMKATTSAINSDFADLMTYMQKESEYFTKGESPTRFGKDIMHGTRSAFALIKEDFTNLVAVMDEIFGASVLAPMAGAKKDLNESMAKISETNVDAAQEFRDLAERLSTMLSKFTEGTPTEASIVVNIKEKALFESIVAYDHPSLGKIKLASEG